MISKVIEEALENLIRRIEKIEEKLSRLSIPDSKGFHQKIGIATSGQIWRIKKEGGTPWEGMTKIEATKEIDRLLKKVTDSHQESPVNEPKEVDTDEAGVDEEGLI